MKIIDKRPIILPQKSVNRFFEAIDFFESAQNEIEDFLIANNKFLMNKIEKARKEHLSGRVADFRQLINKRKYV